MKYEALENLDKGAMQRQLGVSQTDWPRLQLCRRPRASTFLKDVTAISLEFTLDRATLASIVRRVDAAETLQTPSQEQKSAGRLLAARSRKKDKKGQKQDSEDRNES